MSIYYRENGILKKWNINANDIQVLDVDGKYTSHNLEDVLKEVGSGTETNMTRIEGLVDDLGNKLSDATSVIPSVAYGMNNNIVNDGTVSVQPKFTITGKTIINLLGKDGNCEDISKWQSYQNTPSLDTTNKIFGNNGIKMVLTNTTGNISNVLSKYNLDLSKYYLFSAYVKNGNASGIAIAKNNNGGGTQLGSTFITDTTKFTRVGIVIQPSDMNSANALYCYVNGTSGQYGYVDGIMINEITSSEYALGANALLDKYPYVDSYSCLQNPYIEVRHDNMIRNGNGEEGIAWWAFYNTTSSTSLSIVNNKFQLTSITQYQGVQQLIHLKPNTDYYFKSNISGGLTLVIYYIDSSGNYINFAINKTEGTFNTGNIDKNINIFINIQNLSTSTITGTFDSIMLVEGTTAPTSYKPCRIERCVLETKLTSDDSITYDNGEVSGKLWWKHKTLYGKDYDWQYNTDFTGFKAITIYYLDRNVNANNFTHTKYDGKIMSKLSSGWNNGDIVQIEGNGNITISVSDSDTGWVETVSPNSDEVKAYMNGWYTQWNNGSRYVWFRSLINPNPDTDINAHPKGCATTITVATTSTTSITVSDVSIFKVGDTVCIWGNAPVTVSSISGNVLTVSATQNPCPIGRVIAKLDSATDKSMVNFCKNNVAPSYEGYQLHYKLATPEIITDINCHIHGDIPKFDVGENYLYLDTGIVLGEVVNAIASGGYYFTNDIYDSNVYPSKFKNKVEKASTIYKNGLYDIQNWTILNTNGYGNEMYRIPTTSFDNTSTYTVDYKISSSIAPQIGVIGCSYSKDIINSITKLENEMNSRQTHDDILDQIVDLSVYEKFKVNTLDNYRILPTASSTGGTYVEFVFPFSVPKKTVPKISLLNLKLVCAVNWSADITNKFLPAGFQVDTTKAVVVMYTVDSTLMANIKTYGLFGYFTIIADCRDTI